jgi:hypothetical protein
MLCFMSISAFAAVINITSNNGDVTWDNVCTLPEAIRSSNYGSGIFGCNYQPDAGGIAIILGLGTYYSNEEMHVGKAVEIYGEGASTIIEGKASQLFVVRSGGRLLLYNLTAQLGTQDGRVAYVEPQAALHVSYSTIRNGGKTRNWYGAGIYNSGHTTLYHSTIKDNKGNYGGGIYNSPEGDGNGLDIDNSTFSNNQAVYGGAIASYERIRMYNSTVSGNKADNNGGGVYNAYASDASPYFEVFNSTIAYNQAGKIGGGVYAESADNVGTTSTSTIFAKNTAPTGPDYYGCPHRDLSDSGGRNLFGSKSGLKGFQGKTVDQMISEKKDITGKDPLLGSLRNNGGYTFTRMPSSSSPVINKGINTESLSTDQRGSGYPRLKGTQVDIGAVEVK